MKLLRFHLWGLFWAGALQEVCRFVLFLLCFSIMYYFPCLRETNRGHKKGQEKEMSKKFEDGE